MRALPTNLPVYTTPIVSSLPDVTNSQGVSSASFRIDVREDVIPYSQLQERCWYRAVGHPLLPVIVRGFPTRRRPEGCPGLELSYLTLIAAFGKIPHRAPFRLERGPVCLQLVDRIGRDVFCWHNKNLPGDRERCRGGYPQALRHPTFDITISDLRSGRHIICPCVDTQSDVAEGNKLRASFSYGIC